MSKIGIFPAAGKLGGSILKHLVAITNPADVILISRCPAKIDTQYTQAGIETRYADYDVPDSLGKAFNGISHLVLISYPSLELEHRVEAHKLAIDAAINSGVSHIFYTSLAFGGDCSPKSVAHVMQAHLATEAYLKAAVAQSNQLFSFTAIREGIYSESFPMYTGFPSLQSPGSKVKIPHDGVGPGVAWVKIDDLGEATAKLVKKYADLGGKGLAEFQDRVILFSGPKAYTLAETINLLGSTLGKSIGIEQVAVDDYAEDPTVQESLGSHGQGDVPRKWATSFKAVKEGETAVTSIILETVLGRKPESFEATLAAMVNVF